MREEYFDEKYLKDVEPNRFLTNDLELLQKHYTILLSYLKTVERNNMKLKRKNKDLERYVKILEGERNERQRKNDEGIGPDDLWLWLQQ